MDQKSTSKQCEKIMPDNITPIPVSYHLVLPTCNGGSLFTSSCMCNNLAYMIFETAVLHKYDLFAFCIMPDHVHMLLRPGDISVERFVSLIKLRFEYALSKNGHNYPIWQTDFKGYPLSDEVIKDTAMFIFENPVRNGLVGNGIDYPYSFVYGGKRYGL